MIKNYEDLDRIIDAAPSFPIQDMMLKVMYEIEKHEKIMVAVSGGSDSDVLMHLFHLFDQEGKATYVFHNTGLEYDATKRHLAELEELYGVSIEQCPPILPIPTCCKKYGVPFWSKRVSEYIYRLQKHGFTWEDRPFEELYAEYPRCKAALRWWCNEYPRRDNGAESALNIAYAPFLKEYIVANPPTFAISAKCCQKAKKDPAEKYEKTHDFDLACTGLRKAEGGNRATAFTTCISRSSTGPDSFRPLFWLSDKDKQEYKEHFGLKNSDCYEVWGMKRTGCCGCPYGKEFEQELQLMQQYEPKFYKAVLNIFGASYEYTRGYLRFREEMKKLNQ